MLKSEGKGTRLGASGRAETDRKRWLDDEVHVYTTSYGTQYVLPVDLLFSRAELLKYLEEARSAVRTEKENGK